MAERSRRRKSRATTLRYPFLSYPDLKARVFLLLSLFLAKWISFFVSSFRSRLHPPSPCYIRPNSFSLCHWRSSPATRFIFSSEPLTSFEWKPTWLIDYYQIRRSRGRKSRINFNSLDIEQTCQVELRLIIFESTRRIFRLQV